MRKITLISLLLFSKITFSQVSDRFQDGDFLKNPIWVGQTGDFLINANGQLQSNGPQLASQTLALATGNTLTNNAIWTFFVQLNFDPTTSNLVRIYLTSNQADLKQPLNGYFLQIGETGSTDAVHLYKQNGSTISKIMSGLPKTRANVNIFKAKIKVTCDANAKWTIFTDVLGGDNFVEEGSVVDNTFSTSAYMGVYCKYGTASRYNQFIFDDFEVDDLIPDVIPPQLKSININQVEVTFSELVDSVSAKKPLNYSLNGGFGAPQAVFTTNQANVFTLTYPNLFPSGKYQLLVNEVADKKGNQILPNSEANFFYIKPYEAKPAEVVINEIYAHPAGNKNLPAKEFVEIWNTTGEYLLTTGWKFGDKNTSATLSPDTVAPHQHIILCARADTALFKIFGKTIGISPWPSLNNENDDINLKRADGILLDEVKYQNTWYKDVAKKAGGYSLELIDPKNKCLGIQNWIASTDSLGATPGRQNSTFKSQLDDDVLKIKDLALLDSATVLVTFTKMVDSLSATDVQNYQFNNGIGAPISIKTHDLSFKVYQLKFNKALTAGGENELQVTRVSDCAGKVIDQANALAKLFIPKRIEKGDILISELLFNPKPGGVDFVEIYNNSKFILDLKTLQLGNVDAAGKISNLKNITSGSLLIPPDSYWVLSTKSENIKANYWVKYPEHLIQMNSFPAFNNDKGVVWLWSNGQSIDRLDYDAKIHHPLIRNEDGVAIERVSFLQNANAPANFKSAAATAGFATPTYQNSQQINADINSVKLISKTFSPDGDNFEDLLLLAYQFAENDKLANVSIYTDKGLLVKKLLNNQTIGTQGNLTWDGLDENGQKAKVGIYVILFEVFDAKGSIQKFKHTCVLAAKLN